MYRFLSDTFRAATGKRSSATQESADAIAQRREQWVRDRQEKEELTEFFMTSQLGHAVERELKHLDSLPELTRSVSFSYAGKERQPPQPAPGRVSTSLQGSPLTPSPLPGTVVTGKIVTDKTVRSAGPSHQLDTSIERLVFQRRVGQALSAESAALLRRAEADLSGVAVAPPGQPPQMHDAPPAQSPAGPSHETVPVASASAPAQSAAATVATPTPAGSGPSVQTPACAASDAAPLPKRLVMLLTQRWRKAALGALSAASPERTETVVAYLMEVLPFWLGLLDERRELYADAMRMSGVEACIRASLQVLFPYFTTAGRADADVAGSSQLAPSQPRATQCTAIVEILLNILWRLYYDSRAVEGQSGMPSATGMSSSELLLGNPAAFFRLRTGFPELRASESEGSNASRSSVVDSTHPSSGAQSCSPLPWELLEQERCALATDLVSYVLVLSKEGHGAGTSAAAQEKTEGCRVTAVEGTNAQGSCTGSCTALLFMLLLPLRVSSQEVNMAVFSVVGSLSILLARYVGKSDSELLPQIACGFVLVTQLLRECPADMCEAMNNAGLFDNLLNFLLSLGAHFESAEHNDPTLCAASQRELAELVSLDTLQEVRLFSGRARVVEPPLLACVAKDRRADECLHAYLGLLTARKVVRRMNEIVASHRLLSYVDQLELPLVKAFLVAADAGEVRADDAERPVAPDSDDAAGKRQAPMAALRTAAHLHPHSCLFDALVKYALGCLPVSRGSSRAAAGGTAPTAESTANAQVGAAAGDVEKVAHYCRLVDYGLYHVLLLEEKFFAAFRRDPRLLCATVHLLQSVLLLPAASLSSSTASQSSATEDRGVDPEIEAVLDAFFLPQSALASGRTSGSRTFVKFFTANPPWRDATALTATQRDCFVCCLNAVLVHALGGPRGRAVHAAMTAEKAFRVVGHVALKLATDPTRAALVDADSDASVLLPCSWALQVLSELLSDDAVQANVLAEHTDVVFGLILVNSIHPDAEGLLVALLCFHTSAVGATMEAVVEYVRHMQPLVIQMWRVLSVCENLTDTGVSPEKATGEPHLPFLEDAATRDVIFLRVLACVRGAVARLTSGDFADLLTPARMLQHVLCDSQSAGDGLMRLVHRASQPWTPRTATRHGLLSVLQTLTSLIYGNPATRAMLSRTIGATELVTCFRTEWLAAAPDDWEGFVRAMLVVVYETLSPGANEEREEALAGSVGSASVTSQSVRGSVQSIQNPDLLLPLILGFVDVDLSGADTRPVDALKLVLSTLLDTMKRCRASISLVSNAGTFEAVARLLPTAVAASPNGLADVSTADGERAPKRSELLTVMLNTMKLCASHHIDARQMKQFLMSVVHTTPLDARMTVASLVMEVVSASTVTAATSRSCYSFPDSMVSVPVEGGRSSRTLSTQEPQGYIAFRRGSGIPGIKAVVQEFALEGYTICLWLRAEPARVVVPPDNTAGMTATQSSYRSIVSIQNQDRKSVIELRLTSSNALCVAYLDAQRAVATVEFAATVPLYKWTHVALVHRAPNFLTGSSSSKAFSLFLDGAVCGTSGQVPYPPISRGYFFVGISGEDMDRRSVAHALTGQVTSVYLLGCSLGDKELGVLYKRECGFVVAGSSTAGGASDGQGNTSASLVNGRSSGSSLPFFSHDSLASAVASGVVAALESTAATLVGLNEDKSLLGKTLVCIDPRLAERDNRLYNFSAVLRGRQRESVLVTLEGTMVCNATNALDAVCVLGAVSTVVMPFLVLLVNAQLPFSSGGFAPTDSGMGVVVREGNDNTVLRVISLVHVLSTVAAIRQEMIDKGLFVLLSAVLEEIGPLLDMTVPERLLAIIIPRLAEAPALFETAYPVLFLSTELLHACSPETQLIWVNAQRAAVTMDGQVLSAVRAVGAQQFCATELLEFAQSEDAMEDDSAVENTQLVDGQGGCQASTASDGVNARQRKAARLHEADMRDQLLLLLEALTVSPITMSDAVPIQNLVSGAFEAREGISPSVMAELLRRTRLLLFSRDALLCQFLGRKDYAGDLLLLLRLPSAVVRREALLQLLLLTSRSRRTQELMNPALLTSNGVTHVMTDISLEWLRSLLQDCSLDTAVYMVLRCALVGDFGVSTIPTEYVPLQSTDVVSFAPAIGPILTVAKRTNDRLLKSYALSDLVFLLKHNPQAWKRLLTVQGWYIQVVSVYTADVHQQLRSVQDSTRCSDSEASSPNTATDSSERSVARTSVLLPPPPEDEKNVAPSETASSPQTTAVFSACAALLSTALFQALAHETYGATELETAVSYMEEQGVNLLLNQVLCSIAEKMHAKLAASRDTSVANFLGFGRSTALANFTSFVYCVEDVLFYSLAGGTPTQGSFASSTTSGAGWGGAAADAVKTRANYTELTELLFVDESTSALRREVSGTAERGVRGGQSGPLSPTGEARLAAGTKSSEQKLRILSNPDGHWLHIDVALKMADLLVSSATLLNCGGTTFAGGAAETLFASGTHYRKGGFLRIFCRLVRVAASLTLKASLPLDALALLVDRYLRLIDNTASMGFLLLKKKATSLEEAKEHSSLVVTMTLFYALHDLLSRRLRASVTSGGTARFSSINAELLDKLKCLFVLFKKPFEQLPCFTGSHSSNDASSGEYQLVKESTAQWLSTRNFSSNKGLTLDTFAEVASRADYNGFIERCILTTERDQLTDKAIASDVTVERQRRLARLRKVFAAIAIGQQAVLESLKRVVQLRSGGEDDGTGGLGTLSWATVAGGTGSSSDVSSPLFSSSMFRQNSLLSAPAASSASLGGGVGAESPIPTVLASAMMTSAVRASVWSNFVEATKGTIWNVPPEGKPQRKYVSLSSVEQQPLVRRKVLLSTEGTSHRQVTDKAQHGPLSPLAASPSSAGPDEGPDGNPKSRLRLRGGEAVLLESHSIDEEPSYLTYGEDGTPLEPGQGADMPSEANSQPVSPGMNASEHNSPLQATTGDGKEGVDGGSSPKQQEQQPPLQHALLGPEEDNVAATEPVLLSLRCEVPYLLHCWSAAFTIRGGDVCILFDDVNIAYNQKIADEATPFLVRPRNISFNAANIVQLAPARRFRMRRTGIEVWLRDRRSFLVNFPDPGVMRTALQKICQLALARQRKLGDRSVSAFAGGGRRFMHEVAAGLLARPRRHSASSLPSGFGGGASAVFTPINRNFYVLQENPLKEPLRLQYMQMWQNRELSNLDYLLWLNLLSGRSVNDITQYPVFPWVLTDYTSETLDLTNPGVFRDLHQPMGGCGDPARREMVKRRYEDMKAMGDVPAHYFTHYSSPAVVIYFMVRVEPFTTLQLLLQGGHFDHPDRMFHSVQAAFKAVTTSSQDTRELIPELYYLPEVCSNGNDVRFGNKQDGSKMSDLTLPTWAHGSPHEFIYYMRAALESDYVSASLHRWIDLVFGCAQRGKEAIEALNVFNWHSYEDLDRNRGDAVDQQLLIDSLDNIGQTPIQLFRHPHGARRPRDAASPLECGVRLRAVNLRLGTAQRIALLSLELPDKLVVVGGTGVAVSLKVTAQLIRRRSAAGVQGATGIPPEGRPLSPPVALPKDSLAPLSPSPLSSPTAAPAPPPAEPGDGKTAALADGPAPTTSLQPEVIFPAQAGSGGGLGSFAAHGGFELYSFDVSEEFDRRIPPVPPGVIPNAFDGGLVTSPRTASTGSLAATTAANADGPCAPASSALLCFGSEAYVVLGGLYDNSVVIRSLSGLAEDLRLVAHRGRVVRLAASGDSQFLVTGAEDTTFVVWGCSAPSTGSRRATIEVELLFTIYGHEDNPTAVQVSSTLDLVATGSCDGTLMLHSLSSSSLDHTIRHPQGYSIDGLLIQSGCYVPNVLYFSQKDYTIYQISVNGTALRSFTPPGKITSWTTSPEQFLVLSCIPHNRAAASVADSRQNAAAGASASAEASSAPHTAKPPNMNPLGVLYVHSFSLAVLRSVALPEGAVVQSIAVHPSNAQILVLGTQTGSVLLLQSSSLQSTTF